MKDRRKFKARKTSEAKTRGERSLHSISRCYGERTKEEIGMLDGKHSKKTKEGGREELLGIYIEERQIKTCIWKHLSGEGEGSTAPATCVSASERRQTVTEAGLSEG